MTNFTGLSKALSNYVNAIISIIKSLKQSSKLVLDKVDSHVADKDNPHGTTLAMLDGYTKDEYAAILQKKASLGSRVEHVSTLNGLTPEEYRRCNVKLNDFENPFFTKRNADGNLYHRLSLGWGFSGSSVEVVTADNIPQEVRDTIPGRLNTIYLHVNAVKVNFGKPIAGHGFVWLQGNTASGYLAAGFGHVYVVSGRVNNIKSGEHGYTLQRKGLTGNPWHIDARFGHVDEGTVAYLFEPFIVSGYLAHPKYLTYFPGAGATKAPGDRFPWTFTVG